MLIYRLRADTYSPNHILTRKYSSDEYLMCNDSSNERFQYQSFISIFPTLKKRKEKRNEKKRKVSSMCYQTQFSLTYVLDFLI